MNSKYDLDQFGTHVVHTNAPETIFQQNRKSSYGNQLIDDFEKNRYFSEILDTTRNTMQKSVCRYLVPVSRKFWQKLIQIKKTDLRLR